LGTDVETSQHELVLSVGDPLRILRRRLWVIVLVAIVFTGSAVGYSLLQTPTYRASVKILIGQELTNAPADYVPNPGNLSGEVQGLEKITQTMASAVTTRPVAEGVIERLDLQIRPEDLLGNLTAKRAGETQFIEVSYQDSNPERVKETINAVGHEFSKQVSRVSASSTTITATVWEEAAVPVSPVNPNPKRDGAIGLALGCVFGIGLAFLLERLDYRLRSSEEVEQISGVPTFGVIPKHRVPNH
jgi:capsular polysaccharide biosynthesis protein